MASCGDGDSDYMKAGYNRPMTATADIPLERAYGLIDAANTEDPQREQGQPKELLYGRRMTEMLERYCPDAGEAVKLAVRAQHVRRWEIPRAAYSLDKVGYHQWRTGLYRFHAELAGRLVREAGYGDETVEKVMLAVGKKNLRENPDSQLVEDVASLVFLEHYMAGFAAGKPDYTEEKWLGIIAKTWKKMSGRAREFALSGKVLLPGHLLPLIRKAVADAG